MGDHRQVVAHQDIGEAALGPQPRQQVQDLGLHRDVERRGRLVQEQNLRLQDERPGDGDALALAAGKLVRIAIAEGGPEADLSKRLLHPRPNLVQAVDGGRLAHDPVHHVPGVERAVGVLEDHLQPLVERLVAPAALGLAGDGDGPGPVLNQARYGAEDRRFAAAGLADQAEGLAGSHMERNLADRLNPAERNRQGLDPDHGAPQTPGASRQAGSRSSTGSSPPGPSMRGRAARRPRV